jgi:branched-chain amino acid transport system permease protein
MSRLAKIGLIVLGLFLLILPWLVNPYLLQVVILTLTYSMLGLSFNFTLKVGLPRFDITAWWAVGAYTTAMLMWKADMSFWLTLLIGGMIAVGLGWLIFSLAIPRGMMVFLLFGLVLVLAVQQFFGSISFFGGWGGTGVASRATLGPITFVNKPELYYLGLFFLGMTIAVYYLLYNSKIGRAWNAIGSSLKLASSLGIDVVKYRLANVLIGNFFIAIAGGYLVAYSVIIVPDNFGLANSVYIMMYALVGGLAHNLSGPVVGALILTFVPEYLRVAREYEPIITAVITIIIIIFLPMGILSLYDKLVKTRFVHTKRIFPFRFSKKGATKIGN